MRQVSVGIAAVAIFAREGEAAAKCSTAVFDGTGWFDNLNACAASTLATYNQTTLETCVSLLTTAPVQNANLLSILGGSTGCGACAVDYANSAFALIQADGVELVCTAYDEMDDPACVRMLYDALNAFNECSGIGAITDLRTGVAPTTCSYEDFYAWDAKYRPLGDYIISGVAAANDNLVPGNTTTHVPTGCASCMGGFVTGIYSNHGAVNTACTSIADIDAGCLDNEYVRNALDALVVCTGGPGFRTGNQFLPSSAVIEDYSEVVWDGETCTDLDILYLNSYAPYEAIVYCATLTGNTDDTVDETFLDPCLKSINMTIPAIGDFTGCSGCFMNFYHDVIYEANTKCKSSGPFDPACVASLNGEWDAVDNFFYCTSGVKNSPVTGVRLSVAPTQCSSTEIDGLDAKYKTFVSIFETIVTLTSIQDAMTAITDSMAALLAATSGLTCASCFNRLAADMWNLVDGNDLVAAVCADGYAPECASALASALLTFETCSGFEATSGSAYQCTPTEITGIQTAAMVDATYNLAVSSITSVQAVATLDIQLKNLATQLGTDLLCTHCFDNIMRALAALSSTDLAKCSDLTSIGCMLVVGTQLRAFYSCAGFQFISADAAATTAAPTTAATTAAAATTAGATTAAAATSTAAATTAKSATSFVVGVASFVAMMVAL